MLAVAGGSLLDGPRSPAGIAAQLAMLAMLVVLLRVDWAAVPARRRRRPAPPARATP